MITEVLDRSIVLQEAMRIHEHLNLITGHGRGTHSAPPPVDGKDVTDILRKSILSELKKSVSPSTSSVGRGFKGPRTPALSNDAPYISSDPIISIVQSALELYLRDPNTPDSIEIPDGARPAVTAARIARKTANGRIFEKFSVTDIGWVSSVVAMGIRQFVNKHPFNSAAAPSVDMADRCRMIVVGDWGSGIPRAQHVGLTMRRHVNEALASGLECHVVHLGDVYYSGFEYEYRERFLPFWPVDVTQSDRVCSWCLNGNHDMYSGGYGYFDCLLADPRFARQNQSSFFRLANSHWQVLGLDTAWDDDGLKDPQAAWVREHVGSGQRKTVLMSHHQLFSVRENSPDVGKVLRKKLAHVLEADKIDMAVWGHEHRMMTYEPYEHVRFPRLIGHGGVPVWADDFSRSLPFPGRFQSEKWQGGGLNERFANMGFAVMDFDGPRILTTYYSEDGTADLEETIE
uniref:Calcineurin-like phosphoesterase family protein n=1 Tax=Rhizobium rhizogenes TaxID=359 RepID=A0A7S5DQQ8_RHIRH|nr:metallophosphoesterase [Rhizobium rhizogenes]QCL10614.1 calcineurin-like phosphoesterase family protein [Rhizobium rhizogenes]